MNRQLQGSLIQRPNEAPVFTPPPRMERFWHGKEHFGEVTKEEAVGAAKQTGQAAQDLATSDEAKEAGKGIMNIILEGMKILASSAAGIAIFTGILLILEKQVIKGNMSIEALFQMTRIVFFITLGVGFGGLIMTQVMAIKDQAGVIAEDENVQGGLAQAKTTASDAVADTGMEAAIDSDTVNDISSSVPDSVQEGVADASSVVEDSGITS
jgi:hypothetical protein